MNHLLYIIIGAPLVYLVFQVLAVLVWFLFGDDGFSWDKLPEVLFFGLVVSMLGLLAYTVGWAVVEAFNGTG